VADFSAKLGECLEAVDDGPRLQQVLRRYPDDRDELIEFLARSMEIRQLRFPAPSPGFRLRARNALLATAADRQRRRPTFADLGGRLVPHGALRWAAAAAFALAMISSGAIAAENSLPGEPLYPLKLTVEQAQLAITPDPAANFKLRLSLANGRLAEAQQLVARGQLPEALGLITAYDTAVAKLEPQVATTSYAPPDLDRIARDLEQGQVTADERLNAVAQALARDGDSDAAATVLHEQHDIDQALDRTKSSLHHPPEKPRPEPKASPSPH
jgi:hypothetical protein